MTPLWTYKQPTEIHFGLGVRRALPDLVCRLGRRPIFVADRGMMPHANAREVLASLGPEAQAFSDIDPNPTIHSVDALASQIRQQDRDVVVALGGGSSLDCAKAACAIALQGGTARRYHSEGLALDGCRLPLVAIPTTAGTGSEVTPIAVLDDPEKQRKAPLVHDSLFPTIAVIDPELSVSMPPFVTACTGLDALAHAIEGYWSKNHQPICDALACEAAALVFRHLVSAFTAPNDLEAREGMSLAALMGGMAFQLPKNAAVHACSFPLSSRYHMPHGAACAMTLDAFIRFNAETLGKRGVRLARAAGYGDMLALAEAVLQLKQSVGLPSHLREVGVCESDLDSLVEASFHPLMNNNPRSVTPQELRALYESIL
mgnify:CR=1 FL=1